MDDPKRDRALNRVRVLFAVALAVAATTLVLVRATRPAAPALPEPTSPGASGRTGAADAEACPALRSFDPALTALSVEELEQRVVAGGVVPPTAARDQVQGMEAAAAAYAPELRTCMLKVMLVQSVGTLPGLGRLPGLWGRDRSSAEIAQLYRSTPLRSDYSPAQRDDLLAQVEQNVIPHLKAERPEDAEFWRRLYYGLLLTCDATDSALESLGATRPHDCLHFQPRP
jgi:hypothetical protein